MSENKLTFMFVPVVGVGHVNACTGLAEQLRNRGHKIVFVVAHNWKGKLEPFGFQEECYSNSESIEEEEADAKDQAMGTNAMDMWAEMASKMAPSLASTPDEQFETFLYPLICKMIRQAKYIEPKFKAIMARVKPDAIILDSGFHSPALLDSGVPYILSMSLQPMGITTQNVPPAYTGLPTDGNTELWDAINEKRREIYKIPFEDYKNWVVENGGPELQWRFPLFLKYSPFANIYMFPAELDYTMYRPNLPNWHQFDTFMRQETEQENFEIPAQLNKLPGKLIYFSMGTIGSSEVGLMKRLIAILAKSPNRFIVAKGPAGDKYELADNMWGGKDLPQTKILPLVDLVISHGGNNTVTESFYFGKRLLILPLFGDQFDNGQRIYETGFGLQFLPYKVTDEELLPAIEYLLNDELLERRMISASKRIQGSNSQSRAADVIESVALNHRK